MSEPRRKSRTPLRTIWPAAVLSVAALVLPSAAQAEAQHPSQIGKARAIAVADQDPNAVKERRLHPGLTSKARLVEGIWEVTYLAGAKKVALVYVDPVTGRVRESWTGYQVNWQMARGFPGIFGGKLNAPYVFLPLCALFLAGLVDWRRPWRVVNLDLMVLLLFGISNFFFNRAEIGLSVPLAYPVLLYLLARSLWIGLRGRGEGLRPVWPAAWLLAAALLLMGLRVGLNVVDSQPIDVGYASALGAERLTHGEPLYTDTAVGETYGPVNYLAYVPFNLASVHFLAPLLHTWNILPGIHGAALFFDIASFALLFLLGCRIRPGPDGRLLGATLAFAWAAYPYTDYVLQSNSNDTLVAALLIAVLLVLARPIARGILSSLVTFAKFAPAVLVPMLATYRGDDGPAWAGPSPAGTPRRCFWVFAAAFLAMSVVVMAWPLIDPGLSTFWEQTIGFQAGRHSPFSIWGQVGLEPLRVGILIAVAVGSVMLAFRPRRKTLVQVAALGSALLIGLQLTAQHWFYLYIVWFYPLLLIALAGLQQNPLHAGSSDPTREEAHSSSWRLRATVSSRAD
jgi:hypothetical protein